MIYEEVLASVQIDGDAAQTLTSTSTNITVPSGTDIDLTFCATNLLTGNTVSVGGSTVTLTNDCINQTFPSGTASVNFGYTQPSGNCDTGRTFSIGLTVPTTAASTESGDSGSNVGAIVGGICGAFGGIFGASMGGMWWYKNKYKKNQRCNMGGEKGESTDENGSSNVAYNKDKNTTDQFISIDYNKGTQL